MERDDASEEDDGNRFALLGLDDHDSDGDEESGEGGHEHDDITRTDDGDNGGILRQHSQQRGSATGPTAAVGATGVTAAAAAAVGEALEGVARGPSPPEEVEEDHMGSDPYNPDDWKKFAVDEGEVG